MLRTEKFAMATCGSPAPRVRQRFNASGAFVGLRGQFARAIDCAAASAETSCRDAIHVRKDARAPLLQAACVVRRQRAGVARAMGPPPHLGAALCAQKNFDGIKFGLTPVDFRSYDLTPSVCPLA
jgi:hypothetical protein